MKQDIQHIMGVAREICIQIISLTPVDVIMSWGVETVRGTSFHNMPALRMKVNGRLWSDYVVIALDESSDYYQVWLVDSLGIQTRIADEVDFSQLNSVIDTAIEKGTDEEEYYRFCEAERVKLMNGIFD